MFSLSNFPRPRSLTFATSTVTSNTFVSDQDFWTDSIFLDQIKSFAIRSNLSSKFLLNQIEKASKWMGHGLETPNTKSQHSHQVGFWYREMWKKINIHAVGIVCDPPQKDPCHKIASSKPLSNPSSFRALLNCGSSLVCRSALWHEAAFEKCMKRRFCSFGDGFESVKTLKLLAMPQSALWHLIEMSLCVLVGISVTVDGSRSVWGLFLFSFLSAVASQYRCKSTTWMAQIESWLAQKFFNFKS